MRAGRRDLRASLPRMTGETDRLWHRAESLLHQRKIDPARQAYAEIVARDPAHAGAWLRLSTLASMRGRFREASEAALHAANAEPGHPLLRADVLDRLVATGESHAAPVFFARSLLAGWPAEALFGASLSLNTLNLPARALEMADYAWAQGDRGVPLRLLRATLLVFAGRIDEAEAELEAAIAIAPQFASAHWTLSKLRTWSPDRNHVERLRKRISATPTLDPAAPYLWFALYKELEDCGLDDEAWDALTRGCLLKRRSLDFDPAADHALFDRLLATCTPEFLSQQAPAQKGPMPIFIVGMPRSGTTLLERILGAHSQVADAGELQDFPFQMAYAWDHQAPRMLDSHMLATAQRIDYAQLGERYLKRTQWRASPDGTARPWFTDKLPRNAAHVGFIHRALPGARILNLVRDPMDTCFSNLRELFGAAYPHTYDQRELAAHYRDHDRMMSHWQEVLPGRVLDVSYELLVADPEGVAREVFDFVGLPWEAGTSAIEKRTAPSTTASTVQMRQPIDARHQGRWHRYEKRLAPLRDALGDALS